MDNIEQVKSLARDGDSQSSIALGDYYSKLDGTDNTKQAIFWYENSFSNNSINNHALYSLINILRAYVIAVADTSTGFLALPEDMIDEMEEYIAKWEKHLTTAMKIYQDNKSFFSTQQCNFILMAAKDLLYYRGVFLYHRKNYKDSYKYFEGQEEERFLIGKYVSELKLANSDQATAIARKIETYLKSNTQYLQNVSENPTQETMTMFAVSEASLRVGKSLLIFAQPYLKFCDLTELIKNFPEVEPTDTLKCPKCNNVLPNTCKFCNVCGTALIQKPAASPSLIQCPKCNNMLPDTSKFCNACGTQLHTQQLTEQTEAVRIDKSQNTDAQKTAPNYAEALVLAANYYREGEGVDKDLDKAKLLYNKLLDADKNNAKALYGLAYCYYDEDNKEKDRELRLSLLKKSADLGYATAQCSLGWEYAILDDYKQSVFWYEKAAAQDDTDALEDLGFLALFEEGASQFISKQKGFEYLNKSYSLGNFKSASTLGLAYYHCPDESLRDYKKALYFNKMAAMAGDEDSACMVAEAYDEGLGTDVDYYESIMWRIKSAEMGNETALLVLSAIFYDIDSTKFKMKLKPEEMEKILISASDICRNACYTLAMKYEKGDFGKIDKEKAVFYCQKFKTIKPNERAADYQDDDNAAMDWLVDFRQLASNKCSVAIAKWNFDKVEPSDLQSKKEAIEMLEKNISETNDIRSMRVLASIYCGITTVKDIIEDHTISLVSEPLLHDYKKATDLLEKGISLGDEECKNILKEYCSMISELKL